MFAALLRIFNKQVTKAIDNGNNGKDAKGAIAVAGKAAVKLSAAKELLIGSIAGILSRGVTTPLSTITVRKQTAAKAKVQPQDQHAGKSSEVEEEDEDDDDDYSPDSSIAIAKDIYQEHGLSGFWRGYGSACALVSRLPLLAQDNHAHMQHLLIPLAVPTQLDYQSSYHVLSDCSI